jgi:hypothetical protein
MSTARFLLALACSCTSAGIALAGSSAAELELDLARTPGLYLRVDLSTNLVQVMVRGIELDHLQATSVRLLTRGMWQPGAEASLPAVWRIETAPAVSWRKVVAPPTLVPYQEDAPPPQPASTATPPPELPAQYHVELEGGWSFHLGPEPPGQGWDRLRNRIRTGWRRLIGRPLEAPPPAIVVEASAEDSRRLLHVLRAGTAILVLCGDDEPNRPPGRDSAGSGSRPAAPGHPG